MARRIWIFVLLAVLLALLVGGIAWAQETNQPGAIEATASDTETVAPLFLPLQARIVRGTVADVQSGQASVETAEGEIVTVLFAENALLWVPGELPTTTVALEIGDPVVAFGKLETSDSDGKALTAHLVVVASDEELPQIFVQGNVLAVTVQTLVVQTGRGERAITVRPRTRLQSLQGRLACLSNIRPGDRVLALGQPTELGQWVAGLVLVPGANPLVRNGIRGEVMAIDLDQETLTLSTVKRGDLTVFTSDQTRYRIPDVEQPGLADIKVGDVIVVVGRLEPGNETRVQAWGIGLLPLREEE